MSTHPRIKKEDGPRFETCRECGTSWNVSIYQRIPYNGYLCPACAYGYKGSRPGGHPKRRKDNEA